MIVAFCLYKYFPFGGLQRDFMRIAQTVAARGHHVRVYTQSWEGECPDVFELVLYRSSPGQTMVAMRSIIPGSRHIYFSTLSIGLLVLIKCQGWISTMLLTFAMPRKWHKKKVSSIG